MKKVTLTKEISAQQMEWRNHPSIHAWTRQNGLIGQNDMDKWYRHIEDNPSIQMFGILADHYSSDDNIGTCGLTSINHIHGSAEFSLFIAPYAQLNGFGQLALIELLKYGFKNLRLHRIYGESFENNPAIKMFEKIGFRREGTLKESYFKNGKYIDSHIVGILESEAREKEWFMD